VSPAVVLRVSIPHFRRSEGARAVYIMICLRETIAYTKETSFGVKTRVFIVVQKETETHK